VAAVASGWGAILASEMALSVAFPQEVRRAQDQGECYLLSAVHDRGNPAPAMVRAAVVDPSSAARNRGRPALETVRAADRASLGTRRMELQASNPVGHVALVHIAGSESSPA
jgi:hypothetical protein